MEYKILLPYLFCIKPGNRASLPWLTRSVYGALRSTATTYLQAGLATGHAPVRYSRAGQGGRVESRRLAAPSPPYAGHSWLTPPRTKGREGANEAMSPCDAPPRALNPRRYVINGTQAMGRCMHRRTDGHKTATRDGDPPNKPTNTDTPTYALLHTQINTDIHTHLSHGQTYIIHSQ